MDGFLTFQIAAKRHIEFQFSFSNERQLVPKYLNTKASRNKHEKTDNLCNCYAISHLKKKTLLSGLCGTKIKRE